MIVGVLGRLFRLFAQLRTGAASSDLDHVGAELLRLETRRAQLGRRTTSR